MLQHASQHPAIARPNDQNPRRLAVRKQRHMRQHLLINELVALGDLNHPIQQHYTAVRRTLEQKYVLKFTLHPSQLPYYPKPLAPIGIQRLIDPGISRHVGLRIGRWWGRQESAEALPPNPRQGRSLDANP